MVVRTDVIAVVEALILTVLIRQFPHVILVLLWVLVLKVLIVQSFIQRIMGFVNNVENIMA